MYHFGIHDDGTQVWWCQYLRASWRVAARPVPGLHIEGLDEESRALPQKHPEGREFQPEQTRGSLRGRISSAGAHVDRALVELGEVLLKVLKLVVGHLLEIDEVVACTMHRTNQFVQFELHDL